MMMLYIKFNYNTIGWLTLRIYFFENANRHQTTGKLKPHLSIWFRCAKNDCVITILNIWAVTWDFQQCGILTSVDSDEPKQTPFKLINLKWCSVSSLTVIEYLSDYHMRRLVWAFAGHTYHIVGNLMHWLIIYVNVYDAEETYISKY